MKKSLLALLFALAFALGTAGAAFSAHEPKETKGTVTKIEAVEYEVTLKDEKGKEVKVKVKDLKGIKAGDTAIVKDGKLEKAVKPVTGGY